MADLSKLSLDSDEGDISLSFHPSSSIPHVSTLGRTPASPQALAGSPPRSFGLASTSSPPSPLSVRHERAWTAPAQAPLSSLNNGSMTGSGAGTGPSRPAGPNGDRDREPRLFGKALWTKTRNLPEYSLDLDAASGYGSNAYASLDEVDLSEDLDSDASRPPSRPHSRMSSSSSLPTSSADYFASPSTSSSHRPASTPPTASGSNSTMYGGGAEDGDRTPTRETPNLRTPLARRTPSSLSNSSLTRSRSLGNRLSTHADGGAADSPSHGGARTPSMRLGWSRRPGEPRPPPMVDEDTRRRMERWVKEVVVCNFDLERGPVVERRAVGRRWGPGEKENVAFSSFPDTSLFAEGSICFSFKIRHIPPDPRSLAHPEPPSPLPERHVDGFAIPTVEQALLNSTDSPSTSAQTNEATHAPGNGYRAERSGAEFLTPPSSSTSPSSVMSGASFASSASSASSAVAGGGGGALSVSQSMPVMSDGDKAVEYRKWDERGREWLYGFVWFEQRKDKGISRGYMQKSLVILTHLPFPSLFFSILVRVAPVFFQHGYSALEAACHSIAKWPDPHPGQAIELPILSELLPVRLPDEEETPQLTRGGGTPMPDLSAPPQPVLASLPPSSPLRAFATCIPALWSLWECLVLAEPVLVIAPDPKTCSEIVWWLRDLMRPIPPAGDFRPYLHIHDHDFSLLVNSNKPQPGIVVGVTNPFFRNAAAHWPNVISIPADRPGKRAPNGMSSPRPDAPVGFISRRHRSVNKDRALLKRLEALVAEGNLDDRAGNDALRLHFQQLTERFLVPLNRYFQTLVPSGLSPIPPLPGTPSHVAPPTPAQLKPWSTPNFLSHLKNHGPNPLTFRTKGLSSKSRVEHDFYAGFCMSPTFAGWLSGRIEQQGVSLQAAQRVLLSHGHGHGHGHGHHSLGGQDEQTPTRKQQSHTTEGMGLGINTGPPGPIPPPPVSVITNGSTEPATDAHGSRSSNRLSSAHSVSTIDTETDSTRQSSEDGSYASHAMGSHAAAQHVSFRASEDSPRQMTIPVPGDVFGYGARRASDGAVQALGPGRRER